MTVAKKFAALGVATALTASGLVAASGATANAATVTRAVTYNCDLSLLGQGMQPVVATYAVPAFSATLTAGKAVPAKSISAKITLPQPVTQLIAAGFGGMIDGSTKGNFAFGGQSVSSTMTIPSQSVGDGTVAKDVNASGTIAGFTPSTAGAQAVKLPASLSASFQNNAVTVPCTAAAGSNLSLGTVTVAKASNPALKAAQAKLKADQAKLKAAKKALKKAKGHKKVVLKKKVAKLTKAVKADQKKVKSLS